MKNKKKLKIKNWNIFFWFFGFCFCSLSFFACSFKFASRFLSFFSNLKFTGGDNNEKTGFEFRSISIDRTKMSEEEAFEHAIEMIQTRQMGFRKAADFFSVSKWKLYKTARKRGIYAEIKKQNQAQVNKNLFSLWKKKINKYLRF